MLFNVLIVSKFLTPWGEGSDRPPLRFTYIRHGKKQGNQLGGNFSRLTMVGFVGLSAGDNFVLTAQRKRCQLENGSPSRIRNLGNKRVNRYYSSKPLEYLSPLYYCFFSIQQCSSVKSSVFSIYFPFVSWYSSKRREEFTKGGQTIIAYGMVCKYRFKLFYNGSRNRMTAMEVSKHHTKFSSHPQLQ